MSTDSLNLDVLGNPIPTPTPKIKASASTSFFSGIYIWILVLGALIAAFYFFPTVLNYLSLPEEVVEEEVKREVDAKKTQKIVEQAVELKELEERGYCYIGNDRGIRSCIDVKPGDHCMSGKIFPRRDICVNPSLRI